MKLAHVAAAALRGVIPFQRQLRALKRRIQPYADNPANSAHCITEGLRQLEMLQAAGVPVAGRDVLEFGSGWLPLIPMLFHLAGPRRLVLTDVERLMDATTIARAQALVGARLEEAARVLGLPADAARARLQAPFAHDYLVPWDAAAFPAASIDLLISRATFEHVPQAALEGFLRQFHRIVRPGGAMCHVIDNSDHWEHKDKSLSRLDFLRYEDGALRWRLAQVNRQSFQNRLRHSDYIALFQAHGFDVVLQRGEPDPAARASLAGIPLAARFRDRTPDDLAVLTSMFVLRRRP